MIEKGYLGMGIICFPIIRLLAHFLFGKILFKIVVIVLVLKLLAVVLIV